jgi:predicted GNAT family acetyltransferase
MAAGLAPATMRGGVEQTYTSCWFNAFVKISADALANVMADFFQELFLPVPDAQAFRRDGVFAMFSGIPWPTLNPVWLERPNPKTADVASLLDEVAARAVPVALGLRPGSDKGLAELAASRGMTAIGEVPLMAVDAVSEIRSPDEFSIRLLAPDEASLHARLCTAGFGLPDGVAERTVTEDTLKSSAVRCYVGEIAGQSVATGLAITTGAFTGMVNITTDPRYRGRGLGTAITARSVADGLEAGASWCWLQSTPEGYPIYKSYGFQLIESWPVWVSQP